MKIVSRKSALRGAILLLIAAALAVALHFYWRWSVEDYKRRLLARGETLSVTDARAPSPTDEQNALATFEQATAQLGTNVGLLVTNPTLAMQMVAPGKAVVSWRQAELRDESLDRTNSWEEVAETLNRQSKAIGLLRQITNYTSLDPGGNDEPGTGPNPERLEPLMRAAQVLTTAALYHLHRDDPLAATADVRGMLALVRNMREARLASAQLARVAIARMAVGATWELLQSPGLAEDPLAALQRDWTQLEFRQAVENTLILQRALAVAAIERARGSRAACRELLGVPTGGDWLERAGTRSREIAWRYWWSYPDELRALKGLQALLSSARFVQTNYAFRATLLKQRSELSELGIRHLTEASWWEAGPFEKNLRTVFSREVESLSGLFDALEQAQMAKQMAIAAIALNRYRLKHGNYPPELATLIPEFLPALPRDPVDGKALRYQLVGTSFLLYSIGDDGVDNGGDPIAPPPSGSLDWLQGRDYVWPAAATAQDIRAYEKRLTFGPK
jgi:hypothetical protein